MILTGEKNLALPRERVWAALNDPQVLKQCIPGCDAFEPESPHAFTVGMVMAVGPIKARFGGKLVISDIVPPSAYAIRFEGSGGAAGFGKGDAQVRLADTDTGTLLSYSLNAQVGGKLAQVGSRLIDGVAHRVAEDFFDRFARAVQNDLAHDNPTGAPVTAAAITPTHAGTHASTQGSPTSSASRPADAIPSPQTTQVIVREERSLTATIAVLAAAVSSVAAAVAVLAATIMILNTQ